MQGVLLVDKPKDWTSFDVVNFVRKHVAAYEGKKPKNTKVGHCGTLDPQATGLLIIVIGKEYTRRAAEFSKLDKTYEVTMKLGQTSSTGDSEGELTDITATVPGKVSVEAAVQKFTGTIQQTPPIYSAMKVNGQRAYKLARQGKPVELESRPVTIHQSIVTSYQYPYVTFTSNVSSGTYIRSLVEDIGAELGTGAYMSDLRRTIIGSHSIDNAVQAATIDQTILQEKIKTL